MRTAFEALYGRQRDAVYGYLLHLARDEQLAEDLAQETFLKIYLNLHRFKGESSERTWCIAIARNAYFSWVRKKRPEQAGEPLGEEVADRAPTPEESFLQKEKSALVRRVLFSLGSEQRQLILLRDYERLSYKEIGELMGISEIIVKSRLHRARESYREKYRRLEQEWEVE